MNKVVVGMSGGVDSSTAAYILKENGYEVVGVTVRTWEPGDRQSGLTRGSGKGREQIYTSKQIAAQGESPIIEDARQVAHVLDIPYHVLDYREEFRRHVIDYFVSEYHRGRTPNPCIVCNRFVKWESLLGYAREIGADYVATGHYARIDRLPNGRYGIRNSATALKDQTYALYQLTQDQLAHTILPLGDYEKEEIRAIARKAGIPVEAKKDSQDICFVPDGDYVAFIERETGKAGLPGNFVDEEGRVLGQHKGVIHYTIGQRKGLGISADTPLFVKELRMDTNEVVLCRSEELFSRTCYIGDVNYMAIPALEGPLRATGKVRYAHRGAQCVIEPTENGLKCTFDEEQRAMTPGQAAVFYEGEHILCGGIIEKV